MAKNSHKFEYSDFRFGQKKKSKAGRNAMILAVISLLCLPAVIAISVIQGGEGMALIGGIGYLAVAIAVFSIFVSTEESDYEEDVDRRNAKRAKRLAIVSLVVWAAIFIMGIL